MISSIPMFFGIFICGSVIHFTNPPECYDADHFESNPACHQSEQVSVCHRYIDTIWN